MRREGSKGFLLGSRAAVIYFGKPRTDEHFPESRFAFPKLWNSLGLGDLQPGCPEAPGSAGLGADTTEGSRERPGWSDQMKVVTGFNPQPPHVLSAIPRTSQRAMWARGNGQVTGAGRRAFASRQQTKDQEASEQGPS